MCVLHQISAASRWGSTGNTMCLSAIRVGDDGDMCANVDAVTLNPLAAKSLHQLVERYKYHMFLPFEMILCNRT